MSNRTLTPTDLPSTEGKRRKYGPETLLDEIVEIETAVDTPNREEVIKSRKKMLNNNELFRLGEWESFYDQLKNKYPDGLRTILDKACQSVLETTEANRKRKYMNAELGDEIIKKKIKEHTLGRRVNSIYQKKI
jgi:hypothetical protein